MATIAKPVAACCPSTTDHTHTWYSAGPRDYSYCCNDGEGGRAVLYGRNHSGLLRRDGYRPYDATTRSEQDGSVLYLDPSIVRRSKPRTRRYHERKRKLAEHITASLLATWCLHGRHRDIYVL